MNKHQMIEFYMSGYQDRVRILCELTNQIHDECICCLGLCMVCYDWAEHSWINEEALWELFNFNIYKEKWTK